MAALPQFQNVAHNAPVAVPAQAAAIHQYIQQDQAQILQQLDALTNSVNLLVTAVNASHARYASLFYFFRVWLTQLSTAFSGYPCNYLMPHLLTKLPSCTPPTSKKIAKLNSRLNLLIIKVKY